MTTRPRTRAKRPPRHVIVYRKTTELKPDPKNARTHSKAQIEKLRASIREFGFNNPILLKEGDVIGAGNGRHAAAMLEEIAEVPTITLRGLSKDQWRAFALADNRLALDAGWDRAILQVELSKLSLGNIGLTGFSKIELGALKIKGFDVSTPAGTNELGGLQYSVIVRCASEADQVALLARLAKDGLTCEAMIS